MNKQEFAKVVQAWADGENIQCCGPNRKWEDLDDYDYPEWEAVTEYEASYRIKPKDVIEHRYTQAVVDNGAWWPTSCKTLNSNLKLTYTNGILTNSEVLND
jgi:hypothetical protein